MGVHRVTHFAVQASFRIRNFEHLGAVFYHRRFRRRSEEAGWGERTEISFILQYGLEFTDVRRSLSNVYVLRESIRNYKAYGRRRLGRLYRSGRGKVRSDPLLIDGFESFDSCQCAVFGCQVHSELSEHRQMEHEAVPS